MFFGPVALILTQANGILVTGLVNATGKIRMKVRSEFLEEETHGQSKNNTLMDLVNSQSLSESRLDDQCKDESDPGMEFEDTANPTDVHIQPLHLSDMAVEVLTSPIRKYTDVVKSTSPISSTANEPGGPKLIKSVPQFTQGRGKGRQRNLSRPRKSFNTKEHLQIITNKHPNT